MAATWTTHLQASAYNPWRPPNWRWMRARHIGDGGPRQTLRRDDGPQNCFWIHAARQLQRRLDSIQTEDDEFLLASSHPFEYWAHWIYAHRDTHPAAHAIEARILARQTNEEIGFSVHCDKRVISVYHELFFQVRERLNKRDYILHVAIGPNLQTALNERSPELLWKLFAYYCGPHVLDSLMGKLVNPGWASDPDSVAVVLQDVAINTVKRRAVLAALTTRNSDALIETFVRYVEIERATDAGGQAQDTVQQNVQAVLEQLPFRVGTQPNAVAEHSTALLLRSPVELRSDDLMLVNAGKTLPYIVDLEAAKFPEPEPEA